MISTDRDQCSIFLMSNLHFININPTLRFIWYDQIQLLDSGD
ncbi:MAG TPA: 3-hydroxyacyl-CoA dehydrogenase [Enterobacter asburiae]|uniref:3-hydroxyacyl-CoA dehydrogenase n=1 Tax=Enterobacter cloacae TaxID=550 RepID=A0A330EK09_ENTCL|nr:3-hydroxyacyl-CoA dehydrogenase [Enterobacter asburiae]AZV07933.1 3-hydroxyacyl-CoA dehydrogenase [Enterobacter sp. N18-03635]NQF22308.1 3-hydroxyacyl-CoA dehydrogenase [Enterobacter hormaechei]OTW34312.1 3-hydroxyacyl-CoA dehydrogenase [Enterobacter kobei]POV37583.1 3-hydroxyacyl-CoA dehydrogenase [Enterobacter cloacae complex sp. ECNIH11]POV39623.1 3-hydroxyacyl-CoA dehydrogenase [Enterobacter cloacae complex sp. ECNIH16]PVU44274.1 3-hydroxyacyl-CoA dehydrogenase [Enterobacter sp. PN108E